MIDFTSALYLGLEHSWASLPAWPRLTLGKPAALGSVEGASRVEEELARLAGCERATLSPSTLHAFHDVFEALVGPGDEVLLDDDVYPIARLAAGCRARALHESAGRTGARQIIVADGFWPFRGCSPPLAQYSTAARESGGLLVVDDTQALGLGPGGRGVVACGGRGDDHVIVIASLAKAFGVPVAMIAGSGRVIGRLEQSGFSRIHCSPPSAAVVAAAARALNINRQYGEALREKLGANVARLRRGLAELGMLAVPGAFPVQPVGEMKEAEPRALHEFLSQRGVSTILARPSQNARAQLVFVLTARHSFGEIDLALSGLSLWPARRKVHYWRPGEGKGNGDGTGKRHFQRAVQFCGGVRQ